jgi:hypothetical protein
MLGMESHHHFKTASELDIDSSAAPQADAWDMATPCLMDDYSPWSPYDVSEHPDGLNARYSTVRLPGRKPNAPWYLLLTTTYITDLYSPQQQSGTMREKPLPSQV